MFIYFWDTERESMNRGRSEKEGDTESETGSRLWAVSTELNAGLKLTSCVRDHDLSRTKLDAQPTDHPGAPRSVHLRCAMASDAVQPQNTT